MINEEGGVDPEQFRMEAMFDRMDAIGKGVLGLTIQCAQCHNHKYDPITQEDYYRLFAFLNNDHEGSNAGLHARRADEAGRACAGRSARSRRTSGTRTPDWAERMAAVGGGRRRPASPSGRSSQPTVEDISTGGQRYLPQTDGSLPRAGLRADEARGEDDREGGRPEHHRVPPGAAERPEPAARRARALVQGHVRADRVPASRPRPRTARPSPRA